MALQYQDLLDRVEKPGRYIGQEYNMVIKPKDSIKTRFAFCFPDVYEIGMSHLGLQILYGVMNQMPDVACERVFAPGLDMEKLLRQHQMELFTLETKTPLREFDFVGFTLQYELSYTNILNILELGGIPLWANERKAEHPLVVMGGPCAYHAEPLADFTDIFLLGEGEEQIPQLLTLHQSHRAKGYDKQAFLLEAAKTIPGVYVPAFYSVSYHEDGTVKAIAPNQEGLPEKIQKAIVKDIEHVYYPERFLVPNIEIVHPRIMLEIFRGCTRGCRFCQAGMIYRPIREKSIARLTQLSSAAARATGYEEMSLTSLSSSDYSDLPELLDTLNELHQPDMLSISLPSLRLDNFSAQMAQKVQKVKKSGLTFAPEAGTQRLRDVINKGVTEEDLQNTAAQAFSNGWNRIKLYFMIGLPTETAQDIDGIVKLGYQTLDVHRQVNHGKLNPRLGITLSASNFVPKPFTPFQWMAQDTITMLREKQQRIRSQIKNRNLSFSYHDVQASHLEAVLARGDRRLSKVLYEAHQSGCSFDSWEEHFKFSTWQEVFERCGLSMEFYANRERPYSEVLPWDHISVGVSKTYLMRENDLAQAAKTTPDCREVCTGCGVRQFDQGGLC